MKRASAIEFLNMVSELTVAAFLFYYILDMDEAKKDYFLVEPAA